MKHMVYLILLFFLFACSSSPTGNFAADIGDTTSSIVTTTVTTTTCLERVEKRSKYSYDSVEIKEVARNKVSYEQLTYNIPEYEKMMTVGDYNEYVFMDNDDFLEFSTGIKIRGMYRSTGILLYDSITTERTFEIQNTGKEDGIFIIERKFPSMKYYYVNNSRNIQKILISPNQKMNVTFDFDVLCYQIDEVDYLIDTMKYFIEYTEKVRDQKDFFIDQRGSMVYLCERAYFKIIPPVVEVIAEETREEPVIINKQGTDILIEFGKC